MNEWCFKPLFCTVKAILGRRQPGRMRFIWRTGTKPILTPHDGQRKFGLSWIQTCDHPHASPELDHYATDAAFIFSQDFFPL